MTTFPNSAPCPSCEGRGWHPDEDSVAYFTDGWSEVARTDECKKCGGTGKVDPTCPHCEGPLVGLLCVDCDEYWGLAPVARVSASRWAA